MPNEAVVLRAGQEGAVVTGNPGEVLTVQSDGTIKAEPNSSLTPGDRNHAPLAWDAGLSEWLQLGAETALSANGLIGSGNTTMVIGSDTAQINILGANGITNNVFAFEGIALETITGVKVLEWVQSGPSSVAFAFNGETPIVRPIVTGSRGGNAALASLLTALADLGLIVDSSS